MFYSLGYNYKKNYSCDLFFNYEYNQQFKDELVEEDDELKIVEWKKISNKFYI